MITALRRWLQPSLVRRLIVAQMITATLLWVLLWVYTGRQLTIESSEDDLWQMRLGAAMILPLAKALEAQPQLLRETMQRIDAFQRANIVSPETQSSLRLPRIYLWHDGKLLYRSSDASESPVIPRTGALFEVSMDGVPWRAYAEDSADARARFAALTPATPEAFGFTPWSRGWVVLPLLVSLPLLIVPAWLSVRFALRPWAALSREIAARGGDDLAPLRFALAHRELRPLTSAVNQLLQRLRGARERERSFVADAAHELRTPIAAMQVNAEALAERPLATVDRELLRSLLISNARAARLVEQLLTLTRSEALASAHSTAVIDLEALLQDCLAQSATLARAGNIELELTCQSGLTVRGDEASLRILLDNLVNNAVKYSPFGATVQVSAQQTPFALEVLVVDSGPGIAAELRERVFDRFFRAPGQTQSGSGLGLAIAKSVADKNGATIELSDAANGQGLQVRLRFAS